MNIGTGKGISIKDLAALIKNCVEFSGEIVFRSDMPDGALVKIMNAIIAKDYLGWEPKIPLSHGIEEVCKWYEIEMSKNANF